MNLPQFTAEESLLPTIGYYRTNARAAGQSARGAGNIRLAAVGEGEVINVHGCAPGEVLVESGDSWDCLPQSLVNWLLDPGGGVPPDPGGGGGGGGGGGPASIPPDIVADCALVCGNYGEKCCGGAMGPSSCKTCAQTVCQQNKCKDRPGCDPAQLNEAKNEFCDIGCKIKGCKDGLIVKKSAITGNLGGGLAM
jgi:hypothetical protein